MKKKPATTTRSIVEDMLKDAPNLRRRSPLDRMPALVDALRCFLDLKAARDPRVVHVSFMWFYGNKLRPKFGGPGYPSAMDYCRRVLKRDPITGESL